MLLFLYIKCVGVSYALLLAQCFSRYISYACLLNLYFKCVGATYALLLAQCSLRYALGATYALLLAQCSSRYAPYDCMSHAWVLQCSLNYVPYAYNSNEWVLLTHCFGRSAPYAMFLMLVGQMHGHFLRTALK